MSIVGVVAQEVGDGQLPRADRGAIAARRWAASGFNSPEAFGVDTSPYSALFVVARSLALVAPVRAEITKVGFSTSAPETLIDSVQRYVHVVEIVLGGIGLIGLVIAALGITNAMLAAVRAAPGDRGAEGDRCPRSRRAAHLPARSGDARLRRGRDRHDGRVVDRARSRGSGERIPREAGARGRVARSADHGARRRRRRCDVARVGRRHPSRATRAARLPARQAMGDR